MADGENSTLQSAPVLEMTGETTGVIALSSSYMEASGSSIVSPIAAPPEVRRGRMREAIARWCAPLWVLPWWLVSLLAHVLIIALAGLISYAVTLPVDPDVIVLTTTFEAPDSIKMDPGDGRSAGGGDEMKSALLGEAHPEDIEQALQAQMPEMQESVAPPMPTGADPLLNAGVGDATIAVDSGSGGAIAKEVFRPANMGNPTDLTKSVGPSPNSKWSGLKKGSGNGMGFGEIRRVDGRDSWSGFDPLSIGGFGMRSEAGREVMVRRHGGNAATEEAVNKGLAWLAKTQCSDGHWGAHSAMKNFNNPGAELACTGWALLAFLTAGHTEKAGLYTKNVKAAVDFLRRHQNSNGVLGLGGNSMNYGHSIAGMALAEAAGMSKIKETVEAAQKAVDASCALRANTKTSDRGGWNYSVGQNETIQGDMSNSGWTMMFIKSARTAGLRVPTNSVEGIKRYLDACESRETKNDPYTGHRYGYGPIFQVKTVRGLQARQMNSLSFCSARLTAIGILCRLFFGTPANEVEGGYEWMIEKGGYTYAGEGMGINGAAVAPEMYYVYYGTQVAFLIGGEKWKKWNDAMQKALLPRQVKDGSEAGSWSPDSMYANNWGRTGETALSILCLEVYYRYQRGD